MSRPVAVSRRLLEHLAWTHRDEAVIEFNTDTAFLSVDGITFHAALSEDVEQPESDWLTELTELLSDAAEFARLASADEWWRNITGGAA